MESILGMIATEALEEGSEYRTNDDKKKDNLPLIDYRLELIQRKDGTYEWIED